MRCSMNTTHRISHSHYFAKKKETSNKGIYFWLANAQKKQVSTEFESNKTRLLFIADSLLYTYGKEQSETYCNFLSEYFSDSFSPYVLL
jgi:hypothetical protein